MSSVLRWLLPIIFLIHGAIHLLGVAKGLGWARVAQLQRPMSPSAGIAWLVASLLVMAAAITMALGRPSWWWIIAGAAALTSQAVILSAWSDAKVGTIVNILLLLAALYGFVSVGPTSPAAGWRRQAEGALVATPTAQPLVSEADLMVLPDPLAAYIRESGAVGQPRTVNYVANVSGRIRGGPDKGWMSFTGRQVNTYGKEPQRFLVMNARMFGLPIVMTHLLDESSATMHGRLFSVFTVVKASGVEMDRAETVTLFNDLVVMAPGAIPYAPVRWTAVDEHHVRGSFTRGSQEVGAELEFNDQHELVNFSSDDRLRASQDGTSFTPMRWNTPITRYGVFHGRKAASIGEAQWYASAPQGHFTYLDFHVNDIRYNASRSAIGP